MLGASNNWIFVYGRKNVHVITLRTKLWFLKPRIISKQVSIFGKSHWIKNRKFIKIEKTVAHERLSQFWNNVILHFFIRLKRSNSIISQWVLIRHLFITTFFLNIQFLAKLATSRLLIFLVSGVGRAKGIRGDYITLAVRFRAFYPFSVCFSLLTSTMQFSQRTASS